jgi:hypothetical protein
MTRQATVASTPELPDVRPPQQDIQHIEGSTPELPDVQPPEEEIELIQASSTPELPDLRPPQQEIQVIESPPHLEELPTASTETPLPMVNVISLMDNLLHVYLFRQLDVVRARHNIRIPPRHSRELIGSGQHEVDAPYKVNGEA